LHRSPSLTRFSNSFAYRPLGAARRQGRRRKKEGEEDRKEGKNWRSRDSMASSCPRARASGIICAHLRVIASPGVRLDRVGERGVARTRRAVCLWSVHLADAQIDSCLVSRIKTGKKGKKGAGVFRLRSLAAHSSRGGRFRGARKRPVPSLRRGGKRGGGTAPGAAVSQPVVPQEKRTILL